MCGIYGIIGNAPAAFKRKTLIRLALETQIRGEDATGFAWVDEEGVTRVIKQAKKAKEYVNTQAFKDLLKIMPPIVIGHNRKKTVGDPGDNNNNHPFLSKTTGLALIHNGAISNHAKWRVLHDDGTNPFIYAPFEAEVDSEALLRMIETFLLIPRQEDLSVDENVVFATPKEEWVRSVPVEFAIQDAVHNLSGGEACALIDSENPNTVWLWCTTNPLCLAYIKEHDCLIFASTPEILKASLRQVKKKYVTHHEFFHEEITVHDKLPDMVVHKFPVDVLLKITWLVTDDDEENNIFNIETLDLVPNKAKTEPFDFNAHTEPSDVTSFIATQDGVVIKKGE